MRPHRSSAVSPPNRRHVAWLLVAAALCASPAHATKYAGAFMADGGGARALGMGSAFAAVSDDASATFWNPAGLAGMRRPELLLMHSERFGDLIDRDFGAFVYPLGAQGDESPAHVVALSVLHLGIDDIPFTDHLFARLDANSDGVVDEDEVRNLFQYRDEIQFKSDHEFAVMGSYARRAGNWMVGGNLKLIRQAVGDYSSWGVGVDLGALRRDWWRRLDVGMKLQDATSTYLSWNTGHNETVAPVLVPAAAYDWSFPRLNLDLLLASAFELHLDGRGDADQIDLGGSLSGNLNLGLEARLSKRVDLRVGAHEGFDARNFTFGGGLDLRVLRVDYGFAGDVLDIDENTHRISIGRVF